MRRCGNAIITERDAIQRKLYEESLRPPRQKVTQEQFDQILYDAIYRDKTQPPAAIERWAHRHYEVLSDDEWQRRADHRPNGDATTPGFFKSADELNAESSRAYRVFHQNNGDVTKAYYADLSAIGPLGVIAMNLFRAQKRSDAAKAGRRYRGENYEVKQYAMSELARALNAHAHLLDIRWGWREDPHTVFGESASWVLYVELPHQIGQASFHSPTRGLGPEYAREWDGIKGASANRILAFCDWVEKQHGNGKPA